MPTITPTSTSASKVKAYAGGTRPVTHRLYQIDFDSSYPTNGESIASIFSDFKEVLAIFPESRGSRLFEVDYSAQKIKVFTAVGTEATNASNQSTITDVRLWVIGY